MLEMIYKQLKESGVPIEKHHLGMHVPITKESQAIVEQYKPILKIGVVYRRVEHQNWYNIPLY